MKTSSVILKSLLILAGILMLGLGCAKKSDDGKNVSSRGGSLGRGSTGARAVSEQSSQSALDYGMTQGIQEFYIDMISQPTVGMQSYSQVLSVASSIRFNGQTYSLTTSHDPYGNGSISNMSYMNVDNFTMLAQGVCADYQCTTYYLVLTITRQGSGNVLQLAQRQNFNGSGQNTLSYRKPQELISSVQMLYQVLGQPYTNSYY